MLRVLAAVLSGLSRVSQNPTLVVASWLLVVATSLPAMVLMQHAIRTDLGPSRLQEDLQRGLDLGWLEEFQSRTGELGELLQPVRVSSAMWLDNLDLWLSGRWLTEHRGLAAAAVIFLTLWIFLQGGVLPQLANPGSRLHWHELMGSASLYFLRFARLALLTGVLYFGVYRLSLWLFPAIEKWLRDVTVERTVMAANLLAAALIVGLLALVHLTADFAKIATIRESRRSMVLAWLRSLRRVIAHPLQALGVLAVMGGLLVVWQTVYLWVAPGVQGGSLSAMAGAFVVGQVFVMGRWALRLARFGAEIHLFDHWTQTAGRGRQRPDAAQKQTGRS